MDDDDKYSKYDNIPIPTYEEATSSRPTSSLANRGPEEPSDDAERQGLLRSGGGNGGQTRTRTGGYQPASVEDARLSMDSDLSIPEMADDDDDAEAASLRRDMEEMEVDDIDSAHGQRRGRMDFSKRFNMIRHSFSSFSLPNVRMPSFSFITSRIQMPEGYSVSLPIVARLVGIALIVIFLYVLFALDIIPNSRHMVQHYDPESVRARVQSDVDGERIADYLRYISSFDHVAGTEGDLYLAKWQFERWGTQDLDQVAILDYFVYYNYPTKDGRSAKFVDPPELARRATLEDSNGNVQRQKTFTWHGYSKAGNVIGPLVYAHYGSTGDFAYLKDNGIDVEGAVVLMRYYGTEEEAARKIKNAEAHGAVGCLLYADPEEDGYLRGAVYPDGPWRPSDSTQREGLGLTSLVMGDPLTPGWASTLDARRIIESNNQGLVQIPSLPQDWNEASLLLKSILGYGERIQARPEIEYWTGNRTSPKINLQNLQDENKMQQIWNVHGIIQGMETNQKKIIVGNHRDSWCFGAVDPGSGSAVLMEVVNIFGTLRKLGWRPLRTIEFISWDGGEYNLVGSTEYAEDNAEYLRANAVAYLNVDVGVFGDRFRAAASPLLQKPLEHVLDRVADPTLNVSLKQIWDESKSTLEGLNAASDYAPFQYITGTSSLDMGFAGEAHSFPSHSCYETYEWMQRFGDPGFEHHKMLASIWALLILELADRPIIPFDLSAYAVAVTSYVSDLDPDAERLGFNTTSLTAAAEQLTKAVADFHSFDDFWTTQVLGRGGFESNAFAIRRIEHNEKLANFETDMLDLSGMFENESRASDEHGIPGRNQYKHVIFGPSRTNKYQPSYFPAVRDAIEDGDAELAQRQVERAAMIIARAANRLLA
ncbi:hypothetical protein MBLNU457_6098t1 [Dothideomycetes sp. NU457]